MWQDEEEDAVDSELLPEDDSELYYADKNEVAEVEIDEASYLALFGKSDNENDFWRILKLVNIELNFTFF